jgi:hypothetical protein
MTEKLAELFAEHPTVERVQRRVPQKRRVRA